jgi:hypothetical protein
MAIKIDLALITDIKPDDCQAAAQDVWFSEGTQLAQ